MPPPRIRPLVETADIEMVVIIVTQLQRVITRIPWSIPHCPTTQESLRNSITPQMLSKHRINTPWIHPNFSGVPFGVSSSFRVSSSSYRVLKIILVFMDDRYFFRANQVLPLSRLTRLSGFSIFSFSCSSSRVGRKNFLPVGSSPIDNRFL